MCCLLWGRLAENLGFPPREDHPKHESFRRGWISPTRLPVCPRRGLKEGSDGSVSIQAVLWMLPLHLRERGEKEMK